MAVHGWLLRVLREIDGEWTAMAEGAAYVGKPGDAQQTLLDIIGLQSGSVEYHWRDSESLTELYNIINLWGLGPQFWEALTELALQAAGEGLLQRLGWEGAMPEILDHAFLTEAGAIENLIDDRPLSETEAIRAYTETGAKLHPVADRRPPAARWTRSAKSRASPAANRPRCCSTYTSARRCCSATTTRATSCTAPPLHVGKRAAGDEARADLHPRRRRAPPTSESRYAALYKTEPRITQSPTLLVSDYITENLASLVEAAGLVEAARSAGSAGRRADRAARARCSPSTSTPAATASTRGCSALVSAQLEQMRAAPAADGEQPAPQTGAYLGAYAWVEDLRPAQTSLEAGETCPKNSSRRSHRVEPLVHDPATAAICSRRR